MIKDVFVLKKNSWHTKLMKRIWGWDYYDFSNMCPYFWLTVLNTLIAPFLILFDVAVLIAQKISNFVTPYLDAIADAYEKRCNEKRDRWYNSFLDKLDNIIAKENPTEEEFKLLHRIKHADYSDNFYNLYHYKMDYDKKERLTYRYRELEKTYYEKKRQEDEKKYEVKAVKEKNNRQKIADILPIVKMIVKGLGVVALLFVVFLLYKLAVIVVGWDWLNILVNIGKYTAGALIIAIALAIIWFTIKILIKIVVKLWCVFGKYCVPCEQNRDKIGAGFAAVGGAFAYPFIKIGEGCVFMWELIVALKRNNCPGIDWED